MSIITDSSNESYTVQGVSESNSSANIKTALDLTNVANTAAANKIVNSALTTQLALKVPIATSSVAGLSEFSTYTPTVDFAFAEDQIYKANPDVVGGVLVKSRSGVYGEYIRASAATQTDIQGNTQYAPENLLLRSETFDNVAWSKTNVNTPTVVSAATLTPPYSATTGVYNVVANTSGYARLTQTVSTLVDSQMWYTLSVYVKPNSSNFGTLSLEIASSSTTPDASFNLNNRVATVHTAGVVTDVEAVNNGWYCYSISKLLSASSLVTAVGLGGSAVNTNNIYVSAAQLERYPTARPYIATTSAAAYAPRWIYDQTNTVIDYENLSKYSQEFDDTSWTGNGGTVGIAFVTEVNRDASGNVTTGITAPNNDSNAYQIAASTANSKHKLYKTSDFGTHYGYATMSIFAKKVTGSSINEITLQDNTSGGSTVFNIATGTITSGALSDGVGGVIQNAGNGWYRCSRTYLSSGGPGGNIGLTSANPDGTTYTGTGLAADSVYIWGYQIERGSTTRRYTHTIATPLYGVGRSPCLGLISEFGSTNLFYDSQNLSSGWITPQGLTGWGATAYDMYDSADFKAIASTDIFTTYTTNGYTTTRAHGFSNGQTVRIGSVTGSTGINRQDVTTYYAINCTTTTFQLSLTSGGSAIDVTADATGVVVLNSYAQFSVTAGSKDVTAVLRGGSYGQLSYNLLANYVLGGHNKIALSADGTTYETAYKITTPITFVSGYTYTFSVDTPFAATYTAARGRQYILTQAQRAPATDGNVTSQTGTRNPMGVVSNTVFQSSDDTYPYPFQMTQARTLAAGTYTISVFIKKINYRYFTLTINGGAGNAFDFDTETYVVSAAGITAGYSNPRVEKFNDGWYRISVSRTFATAPGAAGQNGLWMCSSDGSGNQGFSFIWDAQVHVWGMQLELGSTFTSYTATSYIPTSSSATSGTTRAGGDALTITGRNFSNIYNANEGTLFVEYKSLHTSTRYVAIISVNDSTANSNRIYIGTANGGAGISSVNTEFAITTNANGVLATATATGNVSNTFGTANRRAALAYKENYGKGFINGTLHGTSVSGAAALPVVNKMLIGGGSERQIIARAEYYNKCLADSTLISLTTL
jgi:hypothetical protein